MTAGLSVTPAGWAGVFIEWMHIAALGFAVTLPLLRALLRYVRGDGPCFQTSFVVHDVASGLTMPSFVALALSGVSPALKSHVDEHAAILAGVIGVVYILSNLRRER